MDTHPIRLHRVLNAKPGLVDQAFLDPDSQCRRLPPNGYPRVNPKSYTGDILCRPSQFLDD